jgi:hypothetical protein
MLRNKRRIVTLDVTLPVLSQQFLASTKIGRVRRAQFRAQISGFQGQGFRKPTPRVGPAAKPHGRPRRAADGARWRGAALVSRPAPGIGSAFPQLSQDQPRGPPCVHKRLIGRHRCCLAPRPPRRRSLYRAAREADALLSALIDRWWSKTLTQVAGQPAAKSATMLTRIAIMLEGGRRSARVAGRHG